MNNESAFKLAEKYHPYWDNLSDASRKLMARNSHQILGEYLDTETGIVLCWTRNAQITGGTGQALRMAKDFNITVMNLANYRNKYDIMKDIQKIIEAVK